GGDAIAVGQNLQVPVSIGMNVLPPGRMTVTVTRSNASLATVSADPTLEGGTSATFTADPGTGTFTVYVQGRNLPGATTLTVQARSEERRVGAEGGPRGGLVHETADVNTT